MENTWDLGGWRFSQHSTGSWFLGLACETVLLVATLPNRKLESGLLWLLSGQSQFYCKKTKQELPECFYLKLEGGTEGSSGGEGEGDLPSSVQAEKGRGPSIKAVLLTGLL